MGRKLKVGEHCKHPCTCECSSPVLYTCSFCALIVCKTCSTTLSGKTPLCKSDCDCLLDFQSDDILIEVDKLTLALKSLVYKGNTLLSEYVQSRVTDIIKDLQNILANKSCFTNGTKVCLCNDHSNTESHISSFNDPVSNHSKLPEATGGETICTDTELVCGTCEGAITLFSNDLNLSFELHRQEPRHVLATKQTDPAEVCATKMKHVSRRNFPRTPAINVNSMQYIDELKNHFSIEDQSVIEISLQRVDYLFRCNLCSVTLHDIESFKVHLKGGPHKNKQRKGMSSKHNSFKKEHELQVSLSKEVETCELCGRSFGTKVSLVQHTQSVHINMSNHIDKSTIKSTLRSQNVGHTVGKDKNTVPVTPNAMNAVLSNINQDESLMPAQGNVSELVQVAKTEDGSKTIVYEPKWIKVAGNVPLSLGFIFKTFSSFGLISKIQTFKKAARLQFSESLVAANLLKRWKTLFLPTNLVLSAVSKEDLKNFSGLISRVELHLPCEAATMVMNEKNFLNCCSYLMQQANHLSKDHAKVDRLCLFLEDLLRETFPYCKCYKFGSQALGLANKNSDVDIFLDIGDNYCGEDESISQKQVCKIVSQALLQSKVCKKIEAIAGARVPIVKFVHTKFNLVCDVSFRSGLGHRNTLLLKLFLEMNDCLRPMILFTKEWLRRAKIPSGKMGMTSYTLILMIIFYLQSLDQPLLPSVSCLQDLASEKVCIKEWNCSLPSKKPIFCKPGHQLSTQDLFVGFCLFYGSFDFQNLIICPLIGRPLKRSLFNSYNDKRLKDLPPILLKYLKAKFEGEVENFQLEKPICVQDPFELSHNVAKGIPESLLIKFQAICLASHKAIMMWGFSANFIAHIPFSFHKARLPLK